MADTRLSLERVSKTYVTHGRQSEVLCNVSLTLAAGELAWVTGPSGCGKTTLINLAALLTPASSGVVRINGRDVSDLAQSGATAVRGRQIGIVFQSHNLLPELTSVENVMIAAGRRRARAVGEHLLAQLGLASHVNARAKTLSGGQQQRVAVARALVNEPSLFLADEPTSGLDRPERGHRPFGHPRDHRQRMRGAGQLARPGRGPNRPSSSSDRRWAAR